jgi:caffeoyl-CoA O-methyltransferase
MPTSPDAQQYADAHTSAFRGAVAGAAAWTRANTGGRVGMMAGLGEAQLLTMLVAVSGAQNVLEVGTFTGVGTLALASGLRGSGQVTTIEVSPDAVDIARRQIEASPWAYRINLLLGDAKEVLGTLPGPFDFVWLDAWKQDYPVYWTALRTKLTMGGVLAADNVLRGGRVYDPAESAPEVEAVRTFNDMVQADPEFDNVLLPIGDGVMLAWRRLDD